MFAIDWYSMFDVSRLTYTSGFFWLYVRRPGSWCEVALMCVDQQTLGMDGVDDDEV